ncbi:ABC transporter permease [Pleomorphomonas koreensis]|uniref:ABC transporter permease n=1 Tax=Pleomorphomonas koreensis TaxID=257440 RepID=UPI00069D943B|nr:ABC transporter permease [Pleomorphomonas koreensis]
MKFTLFSLCRRYPIWVAVLLLYAVASLVSPAMLNPDQVLNIVRVTAFLGMVATGQTIVLLTGGIDLSVAGVVTLVNILSTGLMLGDNGNIFVAMLACVAVAAIVGVTNGVLVAYFRIAPIIATLAMNSILFGVALVYTGGAPHGAAAPAFNTIAQGDILGFPASGVCWLVLSIAVAMLMRKTVFGRWIYAVGANARAAAMMGVPVRLVVVAAYTLSSMLAMCGGLLVTAYIGNPSLGIGNSFMMTSVVAVVVGGTALSGGVGGVVTTIAGALFITELNSFTNIAQASTGAQFVIQGVLIAASVVVYRLLARRPRA